MARNVHMGSVAVSVCPPASHICRIARNPKGVAALPSPRRFAPTLMAMDDNAGDLRGRSGKRGAMTGLAKAAIASMTPARSAIRARPDQSAIDPARPRANWTASREALRAAPVMS
jgi:hypothetical protein